ncbi:hypothetical protein [uncultured Methylobacterium sp.]|uniref:hypothetical protein n=1 Tax=uncultured Methylobacterium sp. TaxID=157278 RepID=UPI0025964230|nr:hypothetical protein [uncultured Methylobacterium sp.]
MSTKFASLLAGTAMSAVLLLPSGAAFAQTFLLETTLTWHATFNLPTQVVEPGLTTDMTYDA